MENKLASVLLLGDRGVGKSSLLSNCQQVIKGQESLSVYEIQHEDTKCSMMMVVCFSHMS